MQHDAGFWLTMAILLTFSVAGAGAIAWSLVFTIYSGVLVFFGLLVGFPFLMFLGVMAISVWRDKHNA